MAIKNEITVVGGRQWMIHEAESMDEALYAINMARCSGSVGSKHVRDDTHTGGTVTVMAHVSRAAT